jgi:hypothetical protein
MSRMPINIWYNAFYIIFYFYFRRHTRIVTIDFLIKKFKIQSMLTKTADVESKKCLAQLADMIK